MLGVDIVEISRINKLVSDPAFINRVYTPLEIAYCTSTKNKSIIASRYAARFAAKEAVFKAIDKLEVLSWKDIQIENEANGKPKVTFSGKAKEIVDADKLGVEISLSHSRNYAVAAAVIKYTNC